MSSLLQNPGIILMAVPLAFVIIVLLVVIPYRFTAWQNPEPSEPEKLDQEIAALERRLTELEAGTAATWQAKILTWQARRKVSDLKRRRLRFTRSAKRWEARAKGVIRDCDMPKAPPTFRLPPTNERIQP